MILSKFVSHNNRKHTTTTTHNNTNDNYFKLASNSNPNEYKSTTTTIIRNECCKCSNQNCLMMRSDDKSKEIFTFKCSCLPLSYLQSSSSRRCFLPCVIYPYTYIFICFLLLTYLSQIIAIENQLLIDIIIIMPSFNVININFNLNCDIRPVLSISHRNALLMPITRFYKYQIF